MYTHTNHNKGMRPRISVFWSTLMKNIVTNNTLTYSSLFVDPAPYTWQCLVLYPCAPCMVSIMHDTHPHDDTIYADYQGVSTALISAGIRSSVVWCFELFWCDINYAPESDRRRPAVIELQVKTKKLFPFILCII